MPYRIGQGYDIHRLIEGPRMFLGGVAIEHPLRLLGHSDGDALLHAITDALLGAIGAGDIGELFPDNDPANKGRDSADFVREAMRRVRAAGYRVVNCDTTVIAQRPKLSAYKRPMAARIAELLGCAAAAVNVKAKTNEGLDAVGEELAVAAQAVVLLARGAEAAE